MSRAEQIAEKKKDAAEAQELKQRRKEALKTLPQFRGTVISRTSLKQLPNVKVNEIFWVEADDKPYIIAEKTEKQMVIKALDETATISTGMTIYDMNKNIVSKEPLFDTQNKEAMQDLNSKLVAWILENKDDFYLMYGRDLHYVTILHRIGATPSEKVLENLIDILNPVGNLISIDFDTVPDNPSAEIWIRTAESKAELMYLMPYDKGIVDF